LRHHAEQFGVLIEAIALRIVWAPDALLRNILEALPVLRKRGSISGRCFVPPKDDIAIGGVIFDQTGFASRLLCSNQCRAGATKRIEHDIAPAAERLFKSGIYYRARQETVPLPELSLAARRDPSIDAEIGFVHPKGVWVGNEEVNEMTVFAGKSDLAITLLLYPNDGAN
jgi:hypothetical protein